MPSEDVESLAARARQLLSEVKDGESRAWQNYERTNADSTQTYLAEWEAHNTWYAQELPRAAGVSHSACETLLAEWQRRMFASHDANEERQGKARADLKAAWAALEPLRVELTDVRVRYREAGGTEILH